MRSRDRSFRRARTGVPVISRRRGKGAALPHALPDRVQDVFRVFARPLREREHGLGRRAALRAGGPVVAGLFRGSVAGDGRRFAAAGVRHRLQMP